MATVIASAGTISDITGNSTNRKLIYDGTRYWAFYMKSGTSNTLFYAYSSNLTSWTETSVALETNTTQGGVTIDVLWDSANSLILVGHFNSSSGNIRYIRGVISGTTISWGANTTYVFASGLSGGLFICEDSSGYAICGFDDNTNPGCARSTNTLSSTFADDGWTSLSPGGDSGSFIRCKVIPLASRNLLVVHTEDASTNIKTGLYNGSSFGSYVDALAVSTYRTCWDACWISDSSIFIASQNAASTLALVQTINQGTSYSSKTAPGWPTNGLATNSQLSLVTDGTDLYLVCIRGNSSCSVSFNKYTVSGNSWGGWTDIETGGTQTRTYINGYWLNSGLKVLYTQTNGSNYDVTVSSYTGASIDQEGFRFRNDDGPE
jgi:hypothetical protein